MLKMIFVWAIALSLLGFFRGYKEVGGDLYVAQPLWVKIALTISIGMISGVLFSLSELFFDRPKFRRWSYGKILITKAVVYFLIVNILLLSSIAIMSLRQELDTLRGMFAQIREDKIFWIILVYFTLVAMIISFVRQMEQKFGPGVLWNMMLGKYRSPKQESRVFMFLDLKDSTTIAEELGHIKFSRLIQDCFYDLNELVPRYKAEIYQYVGDEAVLTWTNKYGIAENNCLQLYFAYADKLEERKDIYISKYGVLPKFKAGVHLGDVTVAEVGVIKKEIAYHGDVLNTAARIQGQCNTFNAKLLISNELRQKTNIEKNLSVTHMGDVLLKGKQKEVQIYAVSEP